jgi:hypothetical protein
LPVDFPDDETMRISHEAIYQALFVQTRGALRRELTACLRTGRVLRMPRARTRRRGKTFISPEIMIAQRPAEAADRAVPGHWEGDLILGLGSSAIGTLVERTTRFTMLLHLPRLAGHGSAPRMKNGPALAGHGAEAVRDAIARTILTLPEQLRRSLTWDQGAEMAQHARLKIDAGVQVYFCDPQRPWQRGPTRTPTDCCDSTFRKAPISACTAPRRSPPWPRPSTPGPGRRSIGERPQRRLTSGSHRKTHSVLRQPFESALAATIRMVDQPGCRTAQGQGFAQSGESQVSVQPVASCPADDPTCEQVDDNGEVQPAFAGPHVGDVGTPLLIGPGCREVLIEQVRRDRPGVMAVGGPLEPQLLPSPQAVVAHQPSDPAAADREAAIPQLPRHSGTAIGAVRQGKGRPHMRE